ncbi:MAG: universal stress protein, partial [Acidimicrobiales bacterium]
ARDSIFAAMAKKILVGTDGSPTASRAVDRAVEVAQASGAEMTIMAVGPRDEAERVVASEASRHASSGISIDSSTASGEASRALVDRAKAGGYDMLVVGNRGMTGIARFMRLGSVPNRVTHHLPCTLLIVKTS